MTAIDDHSNEIQGRIKDKHWIEELIEKGGCCWVCGYYEDPRIIRDKIIELHHIAGKTNSKIMIPVCPTCHAKLSLSQSSWPEDWTLKDNDPKVKQAMMLRGLSELDKLKSFIERELSESLLLEAKEHE